MFLYRQAHSFTTISDFGFLVMVACERSNSNPNKQSKFALLLFEQLSVIVRSGKQLACCCTFRVHQWSEVEYRRLVVLPLNRNDGPVMNTVGMLLYLPSASMVRNRMWMACCFSIGQKRRAGQEYDCLVAVPSRLHGSKDKNMNGSLQFHRIGTRGRSGIR